MAIATELVDDDASRRRDDRRQALFQRINRSAPYLGAFGLGCQTLDVGDPLLIFADFRRRRVALPE